MITVHKGCKKLTYYEFLAELDKLEINDSFLLDKALFNPRYVYRVGKDTNKCFTVRTGKKLKATCITRVEATDDLTADLLGVDFVYYSPKDEGFPPLQLFTFGKETLDSLVKDGLLLKVYDYPLIPFGVSHAKVFDKEGNFLKEEYDKIDSLLQELDEI